MNYFDRTTGQMLLKQSEKLTSSVTSSNTSKAVNLLLSNLTNPNRSEWKKAAQ